MITTTIEELKQQLERALPDHSNGEIDGKRLYIVLIGMIQKMEELEEENEKLKEKR